MTDLLSRGPVDTDASPAPSGDLREAASARRSSSVRAALAGLAAAGSGLALCWVVALVGWYASDGGTHGTTRSALRVGTDAWLLAHDSHLTTRDVTVTAAPLGLSLVLLLLAYRAGRWAGRSSRRSSAVEDLRTAGLSTVVLAGVYAVLALVTGVLASTGGAEPGAMRAFFGGLVVSGAAGGWGLLSGAGLRGRVRAWFPVGAVSAAYGAAASVLLVVAGATVLLATALSVHAGTAGQLVGRIGGGAAGAAFTAGLCLMLLPNAVLLGAAYLLGPGFAVGTATVVSPGQVVLGPVPAVPLLAGLPEHSLPGWAGVGLAGVPVLLGCLGALLAARRMPTLDYASGALRGVAAGAGAALLLAVLIAQAGGAVGSGRMTDLGAPTGEVLLTAVLGLGLGGCVGGLLGCWQARRRELVEAVDGDRPDLRPVLAATRGRAGATLRNLWDRPPSLGHGRLLTPDAPPPGREPEPDPPDQAPLA